MSLSFLFSILFSIFHSLKRALVFLFVIQIIFLCDGNCYDRKITSKDPYLSLVSRIAKKNIRDSPAEQHLHFMMVKLTSVVPAPVQSIPKEGAWESHISESPKKFLSKDAIKEIRKFRKTPMRYLQIALITFSMAFMDFDDPLILFIAFLIADVLVFLTAFVEHSLLVAMMWQAFVVLCLFVVWYTSKQISKTDSYCDEFQKVGKKIGNQNSELGPDEFVNPDRDPPRQNRISNYRNFDVAVQFHIKRANILKDALNTEVMHILLSAVKKTEKSEEGEAFQLGPCVKSYDRIIEKTIQEYDSDFFRVIDILRGTIVCTTMKGVTACYKTLEGLQRDGVISIERVKNRFKKPIPGSGYRDITVNIEFKEFMCEIQITIEEIYNLKNKAHSVYNVVRSLGLGGELDVIDGEAKHSAYIIFPTYILLGGVMIFSSMQAVGVLHGEQLGVARAVPELIWATVLSWPWFMLLQVSISRSAMILERMDRWFAIFISLSYSGMFLFISIMNGLSLDLDKAVIGICIASFHAILLARDFIRYLKRKKIPEKVRSRIGIWYDKNLSINGKYYGYRILAQQFSMILLQSCTKLRRLSILCGFFCTGRRYMFWLFLLALCVNVLYPLACLSRSSFFLQRELPAYFDAAIDFVYGPLYILSCQVAFLGSCSAGENPYPWRAMEYISNILPCFHIYALCCSLDIASLQRKTAENRNRSLRVNKLMALSSRPLFLYGITAGTVVLLSLFVGCRNGYPFKTLGDELGDDTVAKLSTALKDVPYLATLDLNNFNMTDDGAIMLSKNLVHVPNLVTLELWGNRIHDRGAVAISKALQYTPYLSMLSVGKYIGNDGAIVLGGALQHISGLKGLSIHMCCANADSGVIALARAIEYTPSLITLKILTQNITNQSLRVLAGGISGLPRLSTLFLSGIRDGDHNDTIAISKAVANSSSLSFLSLTNSTIGDRGALAIVDAVKYMPSIYRFEVSNINIGDNVALAFADAVKYMPSISIVDVSYNNIGDEAMYALVQALVDAPDFKPLKFKFHNNTLSFDMEQNITNILEEA